MNNELFKLYLAEVNRLDDTDTKKRFKMAKKRLKIDLMDIVLIIALLCFGLITVWNIALEIITKLHF